MEGLVQDLKYALRTLWRSKGVTLAALSALALGIGGSSALFSAIDAVLLRPPPWREPDRVVLLTGTFPHNDLIDIPTSYSEYLDSKRVRALEATGCFTAGTAVLSRGDRAERVRVGYADGDFFRTLGVQPVIGRSFAPDESEAGKSNVALLSWRAFQSRFNGDRAALDARLRLDGDSYQVVGVLPPGFDVGAIGHEIWTPLGLTADQRSELQRGSRYLDVIGRLRPGATRDSLAAELRTLSASLHTEHRRNYQGTDWFLSAAPWSERLVGGARRSLLLLLCAVGALLLIACANVANLLLARAAGREREMAVRAALGADRWRLLRQLLTESAVLGLAGGALGLFLAFWGVDALVALAPDDVPGLAAAHIDLRAVAFTLAVSLGTGLLFGLAPALHGARADLAVPLKDGQRLGARGGRLRAALVVSEVAVALVLLALSGLLLRSFARLLAVPAGFDSVGVISLHVAPGGPRYSQADGSPAPALRRFLAEALERAERLPGALAVGAINLLPLGGRSDRSYEIEGKQYPPGQGPDSEFRVISPGFFPSIGASMASGRNFGPADDAQAPGVAIINESLARAYFKGEEPIGRRLRISARAGNAERVTFTIVGVVRDYRDRALDQEPRATYYLPLAQFPVNDVSFTLRAARSSPAALVALAAGFRQAITEIDREQAVDAVRTLEEVVSSSMAGRRFPMQLLALFAALSLLLAAIGIYGVMSYAVEQRTHELGVRRAVGATAEAVMRLVVGQGLRLAALGIAIGTAVGLALSRVIAGLLFGVSATDPLTFAGIALLLLLVALAACWLPARRAAAVDPMVALRTE